MAELDRTEFLLLVEAASLAPTADNRRELQFEQVGGRIRVWGGHNFTSSSRHRRILGLAAAGAAVENMKLRAGRLGLHTKVHWFPLANQPELVAEVDLVRTPGAPADPIEAAIKQRHTNRRVVFRGPGLSPNELRELAAQADMVDGVQLHWFDSAQARKQIVRIVRIAETDRYRSRELHEELFSSVRFDVGWKTGTDNGLPPGSLEVEAWMRPMFRALRHWKLVRGLHAIGVHHSLGVRAAYLPCRLAPHVGALTTSLDPDAGSVAAGAAFERIWLKVTQLGAELQPFAAPAVFALPVCEWVSPRVHAALQQGWQQLTPGRAPMIVFRIGHAPPPSVRTTREPLESYCRISAEVVSERANLLR